MNTHALRIHLVASKREAQRLGVSRAADDAKPSGRFAYESANARVGAIAQLGRTRLIPGSKAWRAGDRC